MEQKPEDKKPESNPTDLVKLLSENFPYIMQAFKDAAVENAKTERASKVMMLSVVILIVIVAGAALFTGHEDISEKIFVAILAFLGGLGASKSKS